MFYWLVPDDIPLWQYNTIAPYDYDEYEYEADMPFIYI